MPSFLRTLLVVLCALLPLVQAGFFDHVAEQYFNPSNNNQQHYSGYYPGYYNMPYPTYSPPMVGSYYQAYVAPEVFGQRK
ncbi:unnamed protein product [Bursaphelenchus xylophilus]|nr:unnamed protein product [Bursaphelenchus xylophilus]CAG9125593.1 unnamed protein product [Bursaphelenchus xylophilus]